MLNNGVNGDDEGRSILRTCGRDFLRRLAAALCCSNSMAQNKGQNREECYEEIRSLLNEDQKFVHGAIFNLAAQKMRRGGGGGAKGESKEEDDEDDFPPRKQSRKENNKNKRESKKKDRESNHDVSPSVWAKMSAKEKSAHIKKRKDRKP